jgi:hypothetical protein
LLSLSLSGLVVSEHVRLGVGSRKTSSSAEVSLGLSHLGSSEEEGAGSYNLRLIKNTSISNK